MRFVVWLLPVAIFGCGPTLQQRAQQALTVSARALTVADAAFAERYDQEAVRAIATGYQEDAAAIMRPWNTAQTAIQAADSTLRAAQSMVDTADAPKAVPCVLAALSSVVSALQTVGVTVPAELLAAVRMIGAYWGRCEAEGVR